MVRDGRRGHGSRATLGAAPSAAMAEFEELLRRATAAPPRTYGEVKLDKSRRRGSVAEAGGRRR